MFTNLFIVRLTWCARLPVYWFTSSLVLRVSMLPFRTITLHCGAIYLDREGHPHAWESKCSYTSERIWIPLVDYKRTLHRLDTLRTGNASTQLKAKRQQ